MSLRLAIDYDGTLCDRATGAVRAGAPEALRAMKLAGHHLTLFSCRGTPDGNGPVLVDEAARFWQYGDVPARAQVQWGFLEQMRDNLRAAGLWEMFDDVWQSPGKPICDRYIDDRSETPDWLRIRRQYGQEGIT